LDDIPLATGGMAKLASPIKHIQIASPEIVTKRRMHLIQRQFVCKEWFFFQNIFALKMNYLF